MALSDYAVLFAWGAAALVLYASAAAARRRGWVRGDYRSKAAVLLLTGLLVLTAATPKQRQSVRPQPDAAEAAAGRALWDEGHVWKPAIVVICIVGLVFVVGVVIEAATRRGRMPPPPPTVPARRYADRRRA